MKTLFCALAMLIACTASAQAGDCGTGSGRDCTARESARAIRNSCKAQHEGGLTLEQFVEQEVAKYTAKLGKEYAAAAKSDAVNWVKTCKKLGFDILK